MTPRRYHVTFGVQSERHPDGITFTLEFNCERHPDGIKLTLEFKEFDTSMMSR